MQVFRWMLAAALMVAMTAGMTGCKSKRARVGDPNLTGVIGQSITDLEGTDMEGERFVGSEQEGLFSPVFFDYDSAQVNPAEQSKIEQAASHLMNNSAVQMIVEGHCDERGSNEYNLALGERRALAVRAYLISRGIDASRVQTKSLGEERPAAMGHDESAWSQNRRAEFVVVQ
ncbi:MAG: peptidoglycan-associated lipoprotein Pal [Kiritimatiellae bacterium]|nr:peptidoglycan-associated lipoprotein Pal [Kiritimatiellia bacterium]